MYVCMSVYVCVCVCVFLCVYVQCAVRTYNLCICMWVCLCANVTCMCSLSLVLSSKLWGQQEAWIPIWDKKNTTNTITFTVCTAVCRYMYVCVYVQCAVRTYNLPLDLNLTTQCSNCPGWPAVCVKRLHNLAEPCRVVELSLYRKKNPISCWVRCGPSCGPLPYFWPCHLLHAWLRRAPQHFDPAVPTLWSAATAKLLLYSYVPTSLKEIHTSASAHQI